MRRSNRLAGLAALKLKRAAPGYYTYRDARGETWQIVSGEENPDYGTGTIWRVEDPRGVSHDVYYRKGDAVLGLEAMLRQEGRLMGLAGLKIPKTGPMDATLANGEKLSLFYHRESRMWVLQLLDANNDQIGPGYEGTAEYIHSRSEAGEEFDKLARERGGIKKRGLDGIYGQRSAPAIRASTVLLIGIAGFALWKLLSRPSERESYGPEGVGGGSCQNIDGQLAPPKGCGSVTVTGYQNGKGSPIVITEIPGSPGYYLQSAPVNVWAAFQRLREAAQRAGVTLGVNSGFRTMARQNQLYADYLAGRGNKAAKPGYSNHQNGMAVDLAVKAAGNVLPWLRANASAYGFADTVVGEDWHWEYSSSRDRYARNA